MTKRSATWREVRPFVAILLAYVIAAQVLIAGAVGGRIAAAEANGQLPIVICYGGGVPASGNPENPGKAPQHNLPCVLCAAAICTPGLATAEIAQSAPVGRTLLLAPALVQFFAPAHEASQKLSRGPPQLA